MKMPEKEFHLLKQEIKKLQSQVRAKDKIIQEYERD